MFFIKQDEQDRNTYLAYLRGIASLSGLFSNNISPYISYRATENIFCLTFGATNISRTDCSADALKKISDDYTLGFGIKTFLKKNDNSFEKIAEFNKDLSEDFKKKMEPKSIIRRVCMQRNKRLEATYGMLGLDGLIYHCVVRSEGEITIYEQNMDFINLNNLEIEKISNHFYFNDGLNEYQLNLSKSTLLKRFSSKENNPYTFEASILKDPYEIILGLDEGLAAPVYRIPSILEIDETPRKPRIFLPLYSSRNIKASKVYPKSGLNQWNAGGRSRHSDELYIPIPIWIHKRFPDFFPPMDTSFELKLPNQKIIKAKVCQDNGKALMSDPNKDLGHWILRDILKVPAGQVVTYNDLLEIGIDSVEIIKQGHQVFEINFKTIGSFATFANDNKE